MTAVTAPAAELPAELVPADVRAEAARERAWLVERLTGIARVWRRAGHHEHRVEHAVAEDLLAILRGAARWAVGHPKVTADYPSARGAGGPVPQRALAVLLAESDAIVAEALAAASVTEASAP